LFFIFGPSIFLFIIIIYLNVQKKIPEMSKETQALTASLIQCVTRSFLSKPQKFCSQLYKYNPQQEEKGTNFLRKNNLQKKPIAKKNLRKSNNTKSQFRNPISRTTTDRFQNQNIHNQIKPKHCQAVTKPALVLKSLHKPNDHTTITNHLKPSK